MFFGWDPFRPTSPSITSYRWIGTRFVQERQATDISINLLPCKSNRLLTCLPDEFVVLLHKGSEENETPNHEPNSAIQKTWWAASLNRYFNKGNGAEFHTNSDIESVLTISIRSRTRGTPRTGLNNADFHSFICQLYIAFIWDHFWARKLLRVDVRGYYKLAGSGVVMWIHTRKEKRLSNGAVCKLKISTRSGSGFDSES